MRKLIMIDGAENLNQRIRESSGHVFDYDLLKEAIQKTFDHRCLIDFGTQEEWRTYLVKKAHIFGL